MWCCQGPTQLRKYGLKNDLIDKIVPVYTCVGCGKSMRACIVCMDDGSFADRFATIKHIVRCHTTDKLIAGGLEWYTLISEDVGYLSIEPIILHFQQILWVVYQDHVYDNIRQLVLDNRDEFCRTNIGILEFLLGKSILIRIIHMLIKESCMCTFCGLEYASTPTIMMVERHHIICVGLNTKNESC